jgi:hypothetical protein
LKLKLKLKLKTVLSISYSYLDSIYAAVLHRNHFR